MKIVFTVSILFGASLMATGCNNKGSSDTASATRPAYEKAYFTRLTLTKEATSRAGTIAEEKVSLGTVPAVLAKYFDYSIGGSGYARGIEDQTPSQGYSRAFTEDKPYFLDKETIDQMFETAVKWCEAKKSHGEGCGSNHNSDPTIQFENNDNPTFLDKVTALQYVLEGGSFADFGSDNWTDLQKPYLQSLKYYTQVKWYENCEVWSLESNRDCYPKSRRVLKLKLAQRNFEKLYPAERIAKLHELEQEREAALKLTDKIF